MPTYVYECRSCKTEIERVQKFSDPPLEQCPECGGDVKKLLFPVGIVFKGPGFHVNDYRKPEPRNGSRRDSDSSSDTASSKETSAKDSSPAAAAAAG